jgi:hypothetical protein
MSVECVRAGSAGCAGGRESHSEVGRVRESLLREGRSHLDRRAALVDTIANDDHRWPPVQVSPA